MGVQKLNGRQARWAMALSAYDFTISHWPGKSNPADVRRGGLVGNQGQPYMLGIPVFSSRNFQEDNQPFHQSFNRL